MTRDANSDHINPSSSNQEYANRVLAEMWPAERRCPLPPPYVDARGSIQNVLLSPVSSVVVIDSKAGTVRANHYHKTDWHFCYVVSGRIRYYERAIGSKDIPEPIDLGPGSLFFTPPMVEHAMVFTEDTIFLTLSRNTRTHEGHEEDLVRVEFISPDLARSMASR
jgi:quercetin dioxygenase-like cupin family protein